jgi:hypothetical protein
MRKKQETRMEIGESNTGTRELRDELPSDGREKDDSAEDIGSVLR